MARQSGIWNDLRAQYDQGNAVIRLIMLNIAVYVITSLLIVPLYLFFGTDMSTFNAWLRDWCYLPSDLGQLLYRPWSLATYMFMHTGFFHLLFNMLLLFWFGRMVNDLLPNLKALAVYLFGGLAGALVFVLAFNIFPVFAEAKPPIVGASAGVMAIVASAAALAPTARMNFIFIGPVQLRYVVLVLVVFDLIQIPGNNSGGHLAHLGGALMGWFYIRRLQNGQDLAAPLYHLLGYVRIRRKKPLDEPVRKREAKMVYRQNRPPQEDPEPEEYQGYSRSFIQEYRNMNRQECVDAILDKIRRSGYASLSEDEKAFLDRTSKQ